MTIKIKKKRIANIPILEIHKDDNRKKPVVLLMHGFNGKKEAMVERGKSIASEGFFTILPDAYLHGEQSNIDFETISPLKKAEQMDEILITTSNNINVILDKYKTNKMVDMEKIGLIGISLGGNAIYDYISRLKTRNIKVAVSIIATPFWSTHIESAQKEIPGIDQFINEGLITKVKQVEPSPNLKNIKDLPFLMLNGDSDNLVPIEKVREAYDITKANYQEKGRIKMVEYKGIGHKMTEEMFSEATCWITKYME